MQSCQTSWWLLAFDKSPTGFLMGTQAVHIPNSKETTQHSHSAEKDLFASRVCASFWIAQAEWRVLHWHCVIVFVFPWAFSSVTINLTQLVFRHMNPCCFPNQKPYPFTQKPETAGGYPNLAQDQEPIRLNVWSSLVDVVLHWYCRLAQISRVMASIALFFCLLIIFYLHNKTHIFRWKKCCLNKLYSFI